MNLPHTQGGAGEAGAVDLGGSAQAAPANPRYQVGAVGFGPVWSVEDSMAASIVRLEQENDELRAEVALLREEQNILSKRLDARVDPAGIAAEDKAGVIEGHAGDIPDCSDLSPRTNFPKRMTHERIMTGEEYVSYADYLSLQQDRDQWRECAERLAYVLKGQVPWPPSMDNLRVEALAELERLKEGGK
jgi:hypothetical protein